MELEDFTVGDRVWWFDGYRRQEANVVGFEGTTVVLDTKDSTGETCKIWPDYIHKVDN